jgi:hypothetical protein
MRIALITEYLPPKNVAITGGVEARTLSIGKQLSKNHEVHILSSKVNDWDRLRK